MEREWWGYVLGERKDRCGPVMLACHKLKKLLNARDGGNRPTLKIGGSVAPGIGERARFVIVDSSGEAIPDAFLVEFDPHVG